MVVTSGVLQLEISSLVVRAAVEDLGRLGYRQCCEAVVLVKGRLHFLLQAPLRDKHYWRPQSGVCVHNETTPSQVAMPQRLRHRHRPGLLLLLRHPRQRWLDVPRPARQGSARAIRASRHCGREVTAVPISGACQIITLAATTTMKKNWTPAAAVAQWRRSAGQRTVRPQQQPAIEPVAVQTLLRQQKVEADSRSRDTRGDKVSAWVNE